MKICKFSQTIGIGAIAAMLLTLGCKSLPRCESASGTAKKPGRDSSLPCRHVLEVNSVGFLLDLRPHSKGGAITNFHTLTNYLETTVFDGFRKSGKQKMLLFVHGGLNDRKDGMDHFWSDYDNVLRGDYYPVFVVWPSSWNSTYAEHLLWVRQGIRAETTREKVFSILRVR